jgi:hypothetical protein
MHELNQPLPALPNYRHTRFAIMRPAQKASQVRNLADASRMVGGVSGGVAVS